MKPWVLVVGAAGYIGAHMVLTLLQAGYRVVGIDNLSTGRLALYQGGDLVLGDFGDSRLLDRVFDEYAIEAVMHFGARSLVAESMVDPASYYANNMAGTLSLLAAMVRHRVRFCIFSSSAAVYGNPSVVPIAETAVTEPVNPYGRSKRMVEQVLADYGQAYGLQWMALRYFNAAGADRLGRIGEQHEPETHLIPLALHTALGRRAELVVYGRDFPTSDGSGVRDYVHVVDLCSAHLLALRHLQEGGESGCINLGNNKGFSVLEVIATVEAVTGKSVPYRIAPRRSGDPAVLVADAGKAQRTLGWRSQYPDLATMVEDAWRWEKMRV